MIQKDLGFVIRRFNFGETSVIATIYTYRFGKIKGIFKGFYTQKKEFLTPLDIFSLNELIFYPKQSEIWLVSEATLVADFPYLRKDLGKAETAGFLFSLLDRAMQLWDKNTYIFDLTKSCIDLAEKDHLKAFFIFLIKFLTLAGIKPELDHCVICHALVKGALFFSTGRGGLICHKCCSRQQDYKPVSREVSKTFAYIQSNPVIAAKRIQLSPFCQEEIFNIIINFLAYHFDLSLAAFSFAHPLAPVN